MAVSRRLRYEILRRDDHACRYCGQRAPDVALTVDHVVPTALGGGDEADNLVTACQPCNAGKSSTSPDAPIVENVADDALRWSRAMGHAAGIQGMKRQEARAFVQAVDAVWLKWRTQGGDGDVLPRPKDWSQSIEHFQKVGLELSFISDSIDYAMAKDSLRAEATWKYFCGMCWRHLTERQEMAKQMLDCEDIS